MKPVLVVGAGLSAADAVSICRSSGINVIHVYRNRSAGLDKMLPETVYPEYHEVSCFIFFFPLLANDHRFDAKNPYLFMLLVFFFITQKGT